MPSEASAGSYAHGQEAFRPPAMFLKVTSPQYFSHCDMHHACLLNGHLLPSRQRRPDAVAVHAVLSEAGLIWDPQLVRQKLCPLLMEWDARHPKRVRIFAAIHMMNCPLDDVKPFIGSCARC